MEIYVLCSDLLPLNICSQLLIPQAFSEAVIIAHFSEEDSNLLENSGVQNGSEDLGWGGHQLQGFYAQLTLSQHFELLWVLYEVESICKANVSLFNC